MGLHDKYSMVLIMIMRKMIMKVILIEAESNILEMLISYTGFIFLFLHIKHPGGLPIL